MTAAAAAIDVAKHGWRIALLRVLLGFLGVVVDDVCFFRILRFFVCRFDRDDVIASTSAVAVGVGRVVLARGCCLYPYPLRDWCRWRH
jgi:hypothetical protein